MPYSNAVLLQNRAFAIQVPETLHCVLESPENERRNIVAAG